MAEGRLANIHQLRLLFGVGALLLLPAVFIICSRNAALRDVVRHLPVWLRNSPSSSLKGSMPFDGSVWREKPRKFGNYTRWLMLADLRIHYLGSIDTEPHVRRILGAPDDLQWSSDLRYFIYAAYADGPPSPMKPMLALEIDGAGVVKRIAVYFENETDAPSKPAYERAFGPDWAPRGADLN